MSPWSKKRNMKLPLYVIKKPIVNEKPPFLTNSAPPANATENMSSKSYEVSDDLSNQKSRHSERLLLSTIKNLS